MKRINKQKKTIFGAVILIVIVAFAYLYVNTVSLQQSMSYWQATIYYTDGTSRVYTPVTSQSMLIQDPTTGNTVSRISVELYAIPVFTGSVTAWTITAAGRSEIYNTAQMQIWFSGTGQISASGGAIVSNTPVLVSSSTINSSFLDSTLSGQPNGNYYYAMNLVQALTMTLTFQGGSQQSLTQPNTNNFQWTFSYIAGQFTSLSVSWNITPT